MTALCECVPGHRMTVLTSACLDCGFTEREFEEEGNRLCVTRWLDGFSVPAPPMRGRIVAVPL